MEPARLCRVGMGIAVSCWISIGAGIASIVFSVWLFCCCLLFDEGEERVRSYLQECQKGAGNGSM